jgi:hypothetical protein
MIEKLITFLGHPLFPQFLSGLTAVVVVAVSFTKLNAKHPKAALWGALVIALITFASSLAGYRIGEKDKATAEQNHKLEMQKVQGELDAANRTLGHIHDCFTLNFDPKECAITAKILTIEALAAKQTTFAPAYSGAAVGMSIDDQRNLASEELSELASALREDYKVKVIDRRDQMNKAAEANVRERVAAGETLQAARQEAGFTPSGDRQRQSDEAAIMRLFIIPRLDQIRTAVHHANQLVPASDASFTKIRDDIRSKCTDSLPNVDAIRCADSLTDLAASLKARRDDL